MKKRTTLQVERDTLSLLKGVKEYPRETNNDTLKRLIKNAMDKKKIKEKLR